MLDADLYRPEDGSGTGRQNLACRSRDRPGAAAPLNILFAENAANPIALGRALTFNLEGGETMSDDDFMAQGGNKSLIHLDFMIGSAHMDVDGLNADGSTEPVMRNGEWAFQV